MKILDILNNDLNDIAKEEEKIKIETNNQNNINNKIGLSSSEAKKRIEKNGYNNLEEKSNNNPLKTFLNQFKDLLVLILLASTIISVFMQEYVEAITISGIIFVNAVLGFFQELKTEKSLQSLKNMAAPLAKVYRDNKLQQIKASEIVNDDIFIIEAGDRVPADAILIESNSLLSDESILTGESVPVEKKVIKIDNDDIFIIEAGDRVPADAILIESNSLLSDESILTGESVPVEKKVIKIDNNMEISNQLNKTNILYMGTIIIQGRAKAKVIATGMNTQMGNIAGMLNDIEEEQTPLQKKLNALGKYVAVACLIICAIVTIAGIMKGLNIINMLITGISLSVAAVPEGLPAIVTIALALSVKRMIRKNTLIRKLHAVETLGCANIICSDKTGTLTQNKMTAKNIFTLDNILSISGDGYEKAGDFSVNNQRVNALKLETVNKILTTSVLCNNSIITSDEKAFVGRNRTINQAKGNWETIGDPTEIALLVMAAKTGLTKKSLENEYTQIDEIPFDSNKKYMSVIVKNKNGKKYLFTKGAYDIILNQSTYILTESGSKSITQEIKNTISLNNDKMADKALRVLGFAYKELSNDEDYKNQSNLIFLGLVGMIDPPRKEAKQAVKTCLKAGIKTIMITGDNKNTACAIAKQIGIYKDNHKVLTGKELDKISDENLAKQIKDISVFARVSPNNKVQIVRVLKKMGNVVAMTGDGVNDAPAIKEADIGVSMGISGTDVTKQTSQIVRVLKKMGNVVAMTGDGVNDAPAIKEADIGVSMGISGTDVTKQTSEVILLDDNFATLINAVEEGRIIYSNIRKFIRYLLSCNIGEVVTMFLGIIMGLPIVLLPIQILLVNLVTDGLPAIALGLEPAEKDIMKAKPRKSSDGIFANGLLSTIIFRGFLIGLTTLAVFVSLYKYYKDIDISRTGAFITLVLCQLIHVFECKDEKKNLFTVPYLNNIKLILSVIVSASIIFIIVYYPPLQEIFKTVSLNKNQLGIVIFYSLIFPIIKAIYDIIVSKLPKKNKDNI